MPKILAFAGSTRRASLNKQLVAAGAERVRQAGAEVTLIDLRDFPMPLYDGDLEQEQGRPEHATALLDLMREHDGLLLSCPEYNSSITAVLKNAIDWVSRPVEGAPPLVAFRGKVAALLAASPGALGGLRGLVHVRAILQNIGVLVVPSQLAVPRANQVLAGGELSDDDLRTKLDRVVDELVDVTRRLASE